MRTNKEQFTKDFELELQEGTLNISDTVTSETIFILRDGTNINAQFNEFGVRCTDHRQVLSDSRYSMNDLVTIEPESQTIILPDNFLTWEQLKQFDGLDDIYSEIEVQGSNCNSDYVYLVQYLVDCGMDLKDALSIVKNGSWAVIPDDEINDYDENDKDDFIYLDNGTIVDIW